jgi:hypothetical protein
MAYSFINQTTIIKGAKGDRGRDGERGDTGDQGNPGPQGQRGEKGSSGAVIRVSSIGVPVNGALEVPFTNLTPNNNDIAVSNGDIIFFPGGEYGIVTAFTGVNASYIVTGNLESTVGLLDIKHIFTEEGAPSASDLAAANLTTGDYFVYLLNGEYKLGKVTGTSE